MSVPFRVGVVDIGAAGVTLVAILLPPPASKVTPVYEGTAAAYVQPIAEAQAELQTAPDRGAAAEQLAGLLASAGQTDWALRVASQAAVEPTTTDRWRALLGVSGVHAERLEVKDAYEWAQKALTSCESSGGACPPHEQVRLATYTAMLHAGVESGIDPRLDPAAFEAAIQRTVPKIRVRPPRAPSGPGYRTP